MHIYLFFDLACRQIVLRKFPVKSPLACANWRTILSTTSVPCNLFLWYTIILDFEFNARLNWVCEVRNTILKFFVLFCGNEVFKIVKPPIGNL